MSENSVSGSNLRPPKYNGKGGRHFVIFSLHFRAWLNTQGCGGVLDPDFDIVLPGKESERAALFVSASSSYAAVKADAKTKLICSVRHGRKSNLQIDTRTGDRRQVKQGDTVAECGLRLANRKVS